MLDRKTRVLIVDDSAFMRKSLSILLSSDPAMEIVGTARDGIEGVEQVKKLQPDVVTLDIEMPRMDGLSALKIIMKECPVPVIMVSSLTTEGAEATLKALELGAVDFIPKEMSFVSVNISKIKDDLIHKVKTIARHHALKNRLLRFQTSGSFFETKRAQPTGQIPKFGCRAVAIGISTGGPLSLQKVIPVLSEKIKLPVFIVQHMPPKFTRSLAERLNGMSKLSVKEAEDNETVEGGVVYIAPGGFHMNAVNAGLGRQKIVITPEPSTTLHRPSVDVMLKSINQTYGKNVLGVIMTGMGRDGTEGIKELKGLGGYSIAQDEDSCVVYGMPKSIVDSGLADMILPLDKIGEAINKVAVL
jgi:two-component system chemotaxis response regulator CheB